MSRASYWRRWAAVFTLVALGGALIIGALLLAGISPSAAAGTLVSGSVGNLPHLSKTLEKMTPLLLAGLAAFVALKVGLFNIGVEGQLVLGSITAAAVAGAVPGAGGVVLAIFAAVFVGAIWALPAGLIKAYRGGHEVITTIMLNNVAGFLVLYLAAGPLKAAGQQSPETADVLTKIPSLNLAGLNVNYAFVVAVIGAVLAAIWFGRTVLGYEWQAVGANPEAARYAGVSTKKVIVNAMLLSGAIAGFAGAVQVLAYEGRFYPEISSGIGFDALGVALLAGPSALGVLISSFGFGVLATGATQLAILGVPKGITGVVLGVLIILAAVFRYRKVGSHA
jgi:simple sugar transport system permease protein